LVVQAVKKKPHATLTATAVVLASGKVRVSVSSNAKKVKLTYRTAKNKKRTATIKIRQGAGVRTLAKGSKNIRAAALKTAKLRASLKVRVVPTAASVGARGSLTKVNVGPTGDPVACGDYDGGRAVPWYPACDSPMSLPSGNGGGAAWSPDGTKVAFAGCMATSGDCHIFVKDLATGSVSQVSTTADGVSGQANSFPPSVAWSPDGGQVAFVWGPHSSLVPGVGVGTFVLYIKTLSTGALQWLVDDGTWFGDDHNRKYANIPAWSWFQVDPWFQVDGLHVRPDEFGTTLSPDGTRVAFYTRLRLVPGDTNGVSGTDVYVRDLRTGSVTLVSTKADGTQIRGDSAYPVWAPDGNRLLLHVNGEVGFGYFIKDLD
jgi:hypothetical protein